LRFLRLKKGRLASPVARPDLIYTRLGNPTVQALEECVAALENGCGAVATATGMGAVSTVLLALLRHGDHVVSSRPVYGATHRLIENRLSRLGVSSTFLSSTANPSEWKRALRHETRLIFIETPANPTLDLVDIAEASAIAHAAGIPLVVDNTFAGPHLQRPLELGADIVVHSMTKSLNGHSDVIAGIVVTRERPVLQAVRETAITFGMTIDPHQAWLVLRGIRTLGMRVERAQANAMALAEWLEQHRQVAWLRYPGLRSHPQYELARQQMSGPGSIIAFELRGGADAGRIMMNAMTVITLAVSLGGVESLIEHPASMTHNGLTESEQQADGVTPGLVRLSVGCEDLEDLRADLDQALQRCEVVSALSDAR
jgi:methionine-gamma-lyase